jgi:sensor domain CHASE-containing protein
MSTVLILYILIIAYIEREESYYITRSYASAHSIIQKEQESLESVAVDWSVWDDTYEFIKGSNNHYIDTNLLDGTLESLNINFMYFIGKNDENIYLKNYKIQDSDDKAIENKIREKIRDAKKHLNGDTINTITGLVTNSNRLMMVSITPVTTSDGKAPYDGFMAIGKYINRDFTDYLEKVLQVKINISTVKESIEKKKGLEEINSDEGSIWLEKTNHSIASYSFINDIFEKLAFYIGGIFRKKNKTLLSLRAYELEEAKK